MKIAVSLPQIRADPADAVAAAARAEEAGVYGVWVYDNLQPLADPRAPSLEGWTLLAHVARHTRRLALISLVTRAGLRPPALVARMAAVVNAAAPGRLVVGLGAGDGPAFDEEATFGIDVPVDRSFRLAQLDETLDRLAADPLPVRPAGPPPAVWVGGRAADLVDLASRRANAWHGWGLDAAEFAARASRVRAQAGPRRVECWWGDIYRAGTASPTAARLAAAGCDGITWMISSRRPRDLDAVLLEASRQSGTA